MGKVAQAFAALPVRQPTASMHEGHSKPSQGKSPTDLILYSSSTTGLLTARMLLLPLSRLSDPSAIATISAQCNGTITYRNFYNVINRHKIRNTKFATQNTQDAATVFRFSYFWHIQNISKCQRVSLLEQVEELNEGELANRGPHSFTWKMASV